MKRRGSFYMGVVTTVIFVGVAIYFGANIVTALRNTFVTMTAASYTIEVTFPTEGFIVRTETVVHEVPETVLPVVREGERIGRGQDMVVEYLTRQALEIASEIRALRLILEQAEETGAVTGTQAGSLQSVMDLSRAVHSGNFADLDALSLRIESTIFGINLLTEQEITNLRARLELLERQRHGMRIISAPVSGIFSQFVDGLEHISPADVRDLSASELMELFYAPASVSDGIKLITEFKWYYAAVLDADDAARLSLGSTVPVQFLGAFHATIDMRVESVERVGRRDEGSAVVLFSSNRGIHDVTMLRNMQADILFGDITGIRVPKEAIHLDEHGTAHIFLQTGARAERVNVEIIAVTGDSYLLRDGIEANTPLRAGSTIIIRANNIYDGRIVT